MNYLKAAWLFLLRVTGGSAHTAGRLQSLDALRGLAVSEMIVFHVFAHMKVFGLIAAPPFTDVSRYIFLTSVGVSLVLAYQPGIVWKKFAKRQLIIGTSALVATLSTMFLYPTSWVYFGILHLIFVASWLALPFVRLPWLALAIGVTALFTHYYLGWSLNFVHGWFGDLLPKGAIDTFTLVPWGSYVFLGIWFAAMGWHRWIVFPDLMVVRWFAWAGRHALFLYLLHQPIIFGAISLYLYFSK